MGRGKVELKRIENRVSRQVTFSKRRKGLLKKAHELAVLCDVDVGVVVFSERGKMSQYPEPPASLTYLIRRYEAVNNTQLLQGTHCTDHQQEMIAEIGRLRREYEQLEASLMKYTGEDLSSVASVDELDALEQQLESALSKIRARKDELEINLNDELQLQINRTGHHDDAVAAGEVTEEEIAEPLPPSPSFAYLLNVNEKSAASTMLQLWPQTDGDDHDDIASGDGGGSGSSSPPPRGLQLW
ncbi:unnamed protein product [Urochloa decumbens]|uniref:Uncharacterized protein n=1 Tax=Urochloa decumbens TaxID=240449 RepID=A0ABC9DMX5_9POAL